ncbi:hypothetical protein QI037_04865 [Staphylococcus saprophyticus]|jgi:methionyl-tRNA formyltransferase|uniref:Uncharacterized protein n=1 Tax=Staphylococcus saprophyticus subsp. saprophyticus (strain ATCC 15305 / DSM 20229 / NCIMB 8711 / NCTC 7292 / S-41) TaxID=342451 RepID=Q49W30_STAS1|nr:MULTISPECIES: hypothetical protein [Staphylococcus]CRV24502.1 Uncharacterised protein [Streptococcus equi subsp. equi]SIN58235.1 Uncharacterised protein [Mycobacteroides abscessus subsp. abscessus]AMG20963.1 hypothetical protein AL528_12345 [Staphylococcus saprophyticus]AMG34033.1 hypothetical protein AL494_09755 [Staphylococcus saprophyticus]ASE59874.1 hypothetical protein CEQ14_12385 [Staphylococcus saprophyticus]
MKLTYLPEWQLINQSKQAFAIQEDENSISLVSPINDYAMGILSQVFFTIENDEVTDTSVENNSQSLVAEVKKANKQIVIKDI